MPGKKSKDNSNSKMKLLDDHGLPIENDQVLANHGNKYFVSVGPTLANAIPAVDTKDYFDCLHDLYSDIPIVDSFDSITVIELETLVKNIDTSKASNILNINNTLFKSCLLSTLPQVCFLFNLVLKTNEIPTDWKTVTIVPLFKVGNAKLISNYRPISLLPQIVKLFEKLIH